MFSDLSVMHKRAARLLHSCVGLLIINLMLSKWLQNTSKTANISSLKVLLPVFDMMATILCLITYY